MSLAKPISWMRQQSGHLLLPLLDASAQVTGVHTHRFGPPGSGYVDVTQVWHHHHAVAARIPTIIDLENPGWPYLPEDVCKGSLEDILRFLWRLSTEADRSGAPYD